MLRQSKNRPINGVSFIKVKECDGSLSLTKTLIKLLHYTKRSNNVMI